MPSCRPHMISCWMQKLSAPSPSDCEPASPGNCVPSADCGRDPRRYKGGPSKSSMASGSKWVQSCVYRGDGDYPEAKSLEKQRSGQTPPHYNEERSLSEGSGMCESQPSCVPSPSSPGWAYLCVTESPMSLRTICGDPCGRSVGKETKSAG